MNSFSNSDQNDFDALAASNTRISNGINNIHSDLTETNSLIKSGFNSQSGILSTIRSGVSSVGRGISNVYNNNKEQYGVNTQEFSRRVAAMAGGPIGVAVKDVLSNSGINVGNIVKKSIGGVANMFHGHNNKLDNDINDLESINNRQLATDNQQLMEAKKSNKLLDDIKKINAKQLSNKSDTTAINNQARRSSSTPQNTYIPQTSNYSGSNGRQNSTALNNAILKSARNNQNGTSSSPSEIVELLRQIADSQEGLKNFLQDPNGTKEGGVFGTLVKEIVSMPFGFKYWFGGRYSKDIQRSNNPLETIVNALLKSYEWQRIGLDLSRRQLNELIRLQGGQPQKYVGHEGAAITAVKRMGGAIKKGAVKTLGNNAFGRGMGSLLTLPISLLRFGDEDFKDQQYLQAYRTFSEIGKSKEKGLKGLWQNITGGDREMNKILYSERNTRRAIDSILGGDRDNSEIKNIIKDFKKKIKKEDDDKVERLIQDQSIKEYLEVLNNFKHNLEYTDDDLKVFLKRFKDEINEKISKYGLDGIHGSAVDLNSDIFKIKSKSDLEDNYRADDLISYETRSKRREKLEEFKKEQEAIINDITKSSEEKLTAWQNIQNLSSSFDYFSKGTSKIIDKKTYFKNGTSTGVVGEDGKEVINVLPASNSPDAQKGRELFSTTLVKALSEKFSKGKKIIANTYDSTREIIGNTISGFRSKTGNKIIPVTIINPNRKIIASLRSSVGGGYIQEQTVKSGIDDIKKAIVSKDDMPLSDQIAISIGDKISIDKLVQAIKENKDGGAKLISDNIKDLKDTLDPEKSSSKKDGTKNHQEMMEESTEKTNNLLELILKGQSKQKITVDVNNKKDGGLLSMLGSMGQSIGTGLVSTILNHPLLATLIGAGVYGGLKDFFTNGKNGGGFLGGVWDFVKGLGSYTFDNWHNFNQTSSTLSLINQGKKGVVERITSDVKDPYTHEVSSKETVTRGEALQEKVDSAVAKKDALEAKKTSTYEEMVTSKENLDEANRQIRSKTTKLNRLRRELSKETNQSTKLEIEKDIKQTEAQLKQARKAAKTAQNNYKSSSKRFNKFNEKYSVAADKTDKLIEELNSLPADKARQLSRSAVFRTATGRLVRATKTATGWALKPIAGYAAIQNTATIIYDIKTGEWSSAASNFRNFSYYSKHVGGTGMLVGVLDLISHSAIEQTRSKETVNVKFGDRQMELGTEADKVHQDVTRLSQDAVNTRHLFKVANASKRVQAVNNARRAKRAADVAKGTVSVGKGAAGAGTTVAASTATRISGGAFAFAGGAVSGYEAWTRFEAGDIAQGCCQTVCAGLHTAAGICAVTGVGVIATGILEACAMLCDLATYVFDQTELNAAADAIIALKESNLNFLYVEDRNVQAFLEQICKDIDNGKFNKKDGEIDKNKLLIALADNYKAWKKKNGDVTTIIYKIMESDKKFHKDCHKQINAIKRDLIVGSKKLDLEKSYDYNYKASLILLYKDTYLVAASETVDADKMIRESNTNTSEYKYRNKYIDTSLESDLEEIYRSTQDENDKEKDSKIKTLLAANRIRLHKEILDRETEKSAIAMGEGKHGRRDKTGFETLKRTFGSIDTDRLSKVNENASTSAALDLASSPYQFLKHEKGWFDGTDKLGFIQDITAVRDDEYNDETYDPEKFLGIIITKHKHMTERNFGYSMNFEKFKDNGGLTYDQQKRDFAAYIRLALDDKDFESDTKKTYLEKWNNGILPEYPVVYHISDWNSYINLLKNIEKNYRYYNEPIDYTKWNQYDPKYKQNFTQRDEGTKLYEKLSKCKGFDKYYGKCTTWGEFAEKCIHNSCKGTPSLDTSRGSSFRKEFVNAVIASDDGDLEKQRISDGQKLVSEYINWYYSVGHKITAEESKNSDTKEIVAKKVADIKDKVEKAKKDLEMVEQAHKNGTLEMSEEHYKKWKENTEKYIAEAPEKIAEVERNTYSFDAFKSRRELKLFGVSGHNNGTKEENRKQILKQHILRATKDNRKKFGELYKAIKNNSKEISEDDLNERLAEFLKVTGYFDKRLDDYNKIIIEEIISNPDYLDKLINILLNTPQKEIRNKLSELYNDVLEGIYQNGIYDATLDPASEEYDENAIENEAMESYAYGNTDKSTSSVFEDADSITGFLDDGTPVKIFKNDSVLIKERISGFTKSGIPFEIGEKGPEVISNGRIIPVGDNYEAKIAQDRLNKVQEDIISSDTLHFATGTEGANAQSVIQTSISKKISDNVQESVAKSQEQATIAAKELVKFTENNTLLQKATDSLDKINENIKNSQLLNDIKKSLKDGFNVSKDYYNNVMDYIDKNGGILGTLKKGFETATDKLTGLVDAVVEDEDFIKEQNDIATKDLNSGSDEEKAKKQSEFLQEAGLKDMNEFNALDPDLKYEKLKKSKTYGGAIRKELDNKWSNLTVAQDLTPESAQIKAASEIVKKEKENEAKKITKEDLGITDDKEFEKLSDEDKIFKKYQQSESYKNSKDKPTSYAEMDTMETAKLLGLEDKVNERKQQLLDISADNVKKYGDNRPLPTKFSLIDEPKTSEENNAVINTTASTATKVGREQVQSTFDEEPEKFKELPQEWKDAVKKAVEKGDQSDLIDLNDKEYDSLDSNDPEALANSQKRAKLVGEYRAHLNAKKEAEKDAAYRKAYGLKEPEGSQKPVETTADKATEVSTRESSTFTEEPEKFKELPQEWKDAVKKAVEKGDQSALIDLSQQDIPGDEDGSQALKLSNLAGEYRAHLNAKKEAEKDAAYRKAYGLKEPQKPVETTADKATEVSTQESSTSNEEPEKFKELPQEWKDAVKLAVEKGDQSALFDLSQQDIPGDEDGSKSLKLSKLAGEYRAHLNAKREAEIDKAYRKAYGLKEPEGSQKPVETTADRSKDVKIESKESQKPVETTVDKATEVSTRESSDSEKKFDELPQEWKDAVKQAVEKGDQSALVDLLQQDIPDDEDGSKSLKLSKLAGEYRAHLNAKREAEKDAAYRKAYGLKEPNKSVETTTNRSKDVKIESKESQKPVETTADRTKEVTKSNDTDNDFKSKFIEKYPWIDRDDLNDKSIKEYSTRLAKEPWLATVDFVNDADDEMDAADQWDMQKKGYELKQKSGQNSGKIEGTFVGGQLSETKPENVPQEPKVLQQKYSNAEEAKAGWLKYYSDNIPKELLPLLDEGYNVNDIIDYISDKEKNYHNKRTKEIALDLNTSHYSLLKNGNVKFNEDFSKYSGSDSQIEKKYLSDYIKNWDGKSEIFGLKPEIIQQYKDKILEQYNNIDPQKIIENHIYNDDKTTSKINKEYLKKQVSDTVWDTFYNNYNNIKNNEELNDVQEYILRQILWNDKSIDRKEYNKKRYEELMQDEKYKKLNNELTEKFKKEIRDKNTAERNNVVNINKKHQALRDNAIPQLKQGKTAFQLGLSGISSSAGSYIGGADIYNPNVKVADYIADYVGKDILNDTLPIPENVGSKVTTKGDVISAEEYKKRLAASDYDFANGGYEGFSDKPILERNKDGSQTLSSEAGMEAKINLGEMNDGGAAFIPMNDQHTTMMKGLQNYIAEGIQNNGVVPGDKSYKTGTTYSTDSDSEPMKRKLANDLLAGVRGEFADGGVSSKYTTISEKAKFADGGMSEEDKEWSKLKTIDDKIKYLYEGIPQEKVESIKKRLDGYTDFSMEELNKLKKQPFSALVQECKAVDDAENSERGIAINKMRAEGASNDEINYYLGMTDADSRKFGGYGGYGNLKYRVLVKQLGFKLKDGKWIEPEGFDYKGKTRDQVVMDFLREHRNDVDSYADGGIGNFFSNIGDAVVNTFSSDGIGTDRELVDFLTDYIVKNGVEKYLKYAESDNVPVIYNGQETVTTGSFHPIRYIQDMCPIDPDTLPENIRQKLEKGVPNVDTIEAINNRILEISGKGLGYGDRLRERSRWQSLKDYSKAGGGSMGVQKWINNPIGSTIDKVASMFADGGFIDSIKDKFGDITGQSERDTMQFATTCVKHFENIGIDKIAKFLSTDDTNHDPADLLQEFPLSEGTKVGAFNDPRTAAELAIQMMCQKHPEIQKAMEIRTRGMSFDPYERMKAYLSEHNKFASYDSFVDGGSSIIPLASGGIVKQPIIGEKGQEAVIPFNDSFESKQTMMELGGVISDNITDQYPEVFTVLENLLDSNKAKISNLTNTNYKLDIQAGKIGAEQIIDGVKESAGQIISSNNSTMYKVAKGGNSSNVINNVTYNDPDYTYRVAEGSPAYMRA